MRDDIDDLVDWQLSQREGSRKPLHPYTRPAVDPTPPPAPAPDPPARPGRFGDALARLTAALNRRGD